MRKIIFSSVVLMSLGLVLFSCGNNTTEETKPTTDSTIVANDTVKCGTPCDTVKTDTTAQK